MQDIHIIVGLCVDQILPAVKYAFQQKTQLSRFARALCAAHIHIRCQYRTSQIFFFKNRHNSIILCWNKSKKIPRLNNDERNQAVGMLNAGMSATVVSRHFACTRKTIEHLQRRFRVTGNVADGPRSGRPCVTTAADDRYIVLQHLRNRRPTSAATERQYGIHPQTVRNRLRQNIQPVRAYRSYSGQILTRRHRTARRDWCRRHLHFRCADCDWFCFLMNVGLTLAMPTDVREFIAVGESLLSMRASLSGTVSEVVQS